jgi:SAM-dependent methyltransferase
MSRTAAWALALALFGVGVALGLSLPVGREPQTLAEPPSLVPPAKPPTPVPPAKPPVFVFSAAGLSPVEQDKALLALLARARETNGSALYNLGNAIFYWQLWLDRSKGAGAPSILELGPGENLGQGAMLVAMGARKYTGLDLHRPEHLYDRHGYQAAMELIGLAAARGAQLKAAEIFSVEGERVVFNPARVEYLYPRQSYDIRLPDGSIDYAFSHSVFEHISDPAKTVAAIAKVLRRGGLTAHHFDLRDHRDFSKPLEFLKVDAAAWAAQFDGGNAHYFINRQRLSDFVRLFKESGFRIVSVKPTQTFAVSEEMRRGFHPDFHRYSLEDLAVVSALIVAQKP